jgi:hypothetical protein
MSVHRAQAVYEKPAYVGSIKTRLSLVDVFRGTNAYRDERGNWRCSRCKSTIYADTYESKSGLSFFVEWTCWLGAHKIQTKLISGQMIARKKPTETTPIPTAITSTKPPIIYYRSKADTMTMEKVGIATGERVPTYARTGGCDDFCTTLKYRDSVLNKPRYVVIHNPESHENYGLNQASNRTKFDWLIGMGLKMRPDASEVIVDGELVRLSPNQRILLRTIAGIEGGNSATKRDLLFAIGGHEYTYDSGMNGEKNAHILRINISRLRDSLDPRPENRDRFILLVPDIGYRLREKLHGVVDPAPKDICGAEDGEEGGAVGT